MRVLGIYQNGNKVTLHVSLPFEGYYQNPEAGRTCEGVSVKSIYLGEWDITGISPGDDIDIYYGAPITTKNGAYAPIRHIEKLK